MTTSYNCFDMAYINNKIYIICNTGTATNMAMSEINSVPTNKGTAPKAPEPVDPAIAEKLGRLTPRERDVLEELVAGRSNKEVGIELGISPRTVEIHRARLMEKMAANSLAQLVRLAIEAGVEPADT